MVEKYGKDFDILRIKRNIEKLKQMAGECRANSDSFSVKGGGTGCRICGSKENREFVTVYSQYKYCECQNCGSIYLEGLPDIANMYNGDDNVNGNIYTDETYNERIKMIAEPKVDWILEVCGKNYVTVNHWLDIGSGGGEILQVLKAKSIKGVGIESDEREYRFACDKGLDVKNLRVDYENKEIDKMIAASDVVTFFNVLEHIPEPGRFVDYIANNMREGALLVFEVPRHPSIASFANYTGSQFVYRHIVPPIHLSVFSEKAIDYLLAGNFDLIGKWYFGQGYVDILNNAMLLSGAEDHPIYSKALDISNEVQAVIDENGLSDQIMIIAKKVIS